MAGMSAPNRSMRHGNRAFTKPGWLLLLIPVVVQAHLMPHGKGAVRILDSTVCLDATLPISALGPAGKHLDSAALLSGREGLLEVLRSRFAVQDKNRAGRVLFENLDLSGPSHVRLTRCLRWPWLVERLSIRADVFEGASDTDRQLTLRASRGELVEVVVFNPARTERELFRGAWRTFVAFVGIGLLHILTGFDHLLFLLTILVAGSGWRHWLKVVSAFTVAHSITLALAVTGRINVSPTVVEPLIAASIVVVALDNFRRGSGARRYQAAVVFACGLLHGMGFASAITDLGLNGSGLLASLVGFNLGVEAGQGVFLATLLGIWALVGRIPRVVPRPAIGIRAISLVAVVVGLVLFLQRIL